MLLFLDFQIIFIVFIFEYIPGLHMKLNIVSMKGQISLQFHCDVHVTRTWFHHQSRKANLNNCLLTSQPFFPLSTSYL